MNRFKELDFIRAVSIVAVVTIHASVQLLKNSEATFGSQIFCITINQLSRFAVPSFLFVSGILAFHSIEQLKLRKLLINRFFQLVVPYLIWTVIGLLIFPTSSLVDLGYAFILGQGPFYHLYYIPLLIQMYLLLPLIKKAYSKTLYITLFTASVIIFIGYQAVQFDFLLIPKHLPIQNLIQATFPAWLIYFALGYAIGKNYAVFISKINETPLLNILILYIASVGFLALDCYWSWKTSGRLNGPHYEYYRISVFVYSVSSILLLFKIGGRIHSLIVDKLYSNSFGIYLNHLLVIIYLKKITNGYLFSDTLTTVLGILVTLVFSYTINIILRLTIFSKLLLGQKSKSNFFN